MTHEAENIILRAQLAAAHRLLDELAERVARSAPSPSSLVPRFLTAAEIAARLRINVKYFYNISGTLGVPGFRIGGRGEYRVNEAEFNAWIESWKGAAQSPDGSRRGRSRPSPTRKAA